LKQKPNAHQLDNDEHHPAPLCRLSTYLLIEHVRVYLDGARSEEGGNDGDDVDGELELEELGDAVVDVATPHHRLDDTREVVVGQYDVRCLFGYVCARYALHQRHSRMQKI